MTDEPPPPDADLDTEGAPAEQVRSPDRTFAWWTRQLRRWTAWLVVVGVLAATLLAFAAPDLWLAEIVASFRPHLAAATLVAALAVLVVLRCPVPALVLVGLAATNAWPVVQVVRTDPPPAADGPVVTIASYNAQGGFGDTVEILEYLASDPADVVVVLEPVPDWAIFMREPAAQIGWDLAYPRSGGAVGRVMVFSQIPLRDVQRPAGVDLPAATVEMTFDLADQEVDLLALHTQSPVGPTRWDARRAQLEAAAAWAEEQDGAAAVMGDLNLVPWSPTFTDFADQLDMVSSTDVGGVQLSWWFRGRRPTPLALPIDHLLHTPDLATVDRRIDPTFGSEHGVLVVGLAPAAG